MNQSEIDQKTGVFSPDYCEHGCPVCTRARRGVGWARFVQKLEMIFTFGGCPWGRARKKKYGVSPMEPLPDAPDDDNSPSDGDS